MTLNPIPGTTLHNMIVEGLSMPAAAASSFLDQEIPREPDGVKLFLGELGKSGSGGFSTKTKQLTGVYK